MRLLTQLSLAALTVLAAAGARGEGLAERVVIVANSDDPDSVPIGEHYAAVRGVPAANLIALPMPTNETITWPEFVKTVWQPLQDELVRRSWIDAIPMNLTDEVGRRKYYIAGHRIAAMVLCRGVPLRIENDPGLFVEWKPITNNSQFRTNEGSVDSELSLLPQTDYPINAYIPNPMFRREHPTDFQRAQVVEVTRLDGPSVSDAFGLVDRAVAAEKSGLLGRAYFDLGGPHADGDKWLQAASLRAINLGFDTSVDREPSTFPATVRFDAPALYFGWYASDLNGPFALPGFRFPRGAIALHIHSYSAVTLRSATKGWCGPLVARGVTATFGNVFEPYLGLTHRPDLLLEALSRGETLADAAYYALPVLSWQAVVIGDPLYRPFAVQLPDQLRHVESLPSRLAGYAIVRRMNLLDAAGRRQEALALGRSGMKECPSLGLALSLAQRLQTTGRGEEAWHVLEAATNETVPTTDEWGLMREAAQFLAAHRRGATAVEVFKRLLAIDQVPLAVRSNWLVNARDAAQAAGDFEQETAWKQEIGVNVSRSLEEPK